MSDTWINWGDFIGKNQGQLDAYDAKVAASQAEQQAAMQAGLDRLGTDYGNAAKAQEGEYQRLTDILYDNTKDTYRTPGEVPSGSTITPTQGARVSARPGAGAPIGRVTAPQPKTDASGQFNFTPASQSYSALMAAQNNAQANAFKGYQAASAPGWQNALYSTHTQYVDPWTQLQSKIDPITSDYERRTAAAKSSYDANVAERKASLGKTTKPVSTDVNGAPVYGQQEDTGPRNVPIKPKKDLEPVVGYA
jgi:hypothetical protein